MAGGEDVRELWDTWRQAGNTWDKFWGNKNWRLRHRLLWKERPQLLELGSNPYMLLMTAQVYVGEGGRLPANRVELFAAFVDTLMGREQKRSAERWIEAGLQKEGLSSLAYAMQAEGGRGTTVGRKWAVSLLCREVPGCDAENLLYLTASATLLDVNGGTVRFYHQLLQEYFAAHKMGRRLMGGEDPARYWQPESWWEPSGWEETAILAAGMEEGASDLLNRLLPINPVVAARCLVEGGTEAGEDTRQKIADTLISRMTDDVRQSAAARAAAGRNLAKLGDPRPGVDPSATALEQMEFCYVPPGEFVMGDESYGEYTLDIPYGYWMARYPVTVAQFCAFVDATGHNVDEDSLKGIENHPVVYVSWYNALEYCKWLTERWKGLLPEGYVIMLPSEAEWEKAARGGVEVPAESTVSSIGEGLTPGAGGGKMVRNPNPKRRYPWGDDPDPNRANYNTTGIGTTSAVGCFPGGASPYGVLDMSGNVWEWTRSVYKGYPYDPKDGREDLKASGSRVVRGGSFINDGWGVRCAFRSRRSPYYRVNLRGVRLSAVPSIFHTFVRPESSGLGS